MVRKYFRKCGISNSLDDEEDDALFADLLKMKKTTDAAECEMTVDDNSEDHELMSDVDTEEYYYDTTNDQLIQDILYGSSDDEEFDGF